MTARIRIALLTIAVAVTTVTGSLYVYGRYRLKALPPIAREDPNTFIAEEVRPFHTRLSVSERQHLLDGDFVLITSTERLPQSIKDAFASITGGKPFALTNPGEKYQITDVIEEPGLPNRRLIFAGSCKNRWFLQYEHGGIGISDAVIVLDTWPNNSVHFVWGGSSFKPAANLNDLRSAIASGKFADDPNAYW